EIHTQRRVIDFFHDALGYEYLGNWKDRAGNANVETQHAASLREARREKVRQVKQGMMQALLTGRVRLVEAQEEGNL
ncbi:hypothetical protein FKZ61_014140, partial [Litorilinea aerophila]|uniref:hypothetical protein n=1 Tax=Litorilinea aerophila TaxID=1204385 RepID=UPI0014773FF0